MNQLLGKTYIEVQSSAFTAHRKASITSDSKGRLSAEITYNDEQSSKHVTSLLGMFLAKTVSRITDVYGPNVNLSFAMQPDCNSSVPRAIREGRRKERRFSMWQDELLKVFIYFYTFFFMDLRVFIVLRYLFIHSHDLPLKSSDNYVYSN